MLLLILAATSALRAQTAQISGFVKDAQEAGVPHAQVVIQNLDTDAKRTALTAEGGLYTIPFLAPGSYRLTVTAEGFQTMVREGIRLEVNQNARLDLTLVLGSVQESISVSGDAPLINTADASVSTVVDRQFVENVPLNGRSFQSLITLTPGIVTVPVLSTGGQGEFSVNGQRTEGNYYTVDGVSATNGSYNGSGTLPNGLSGNVPAETALGTTQSLVSLDALQEFRIQTSTYSAEYGRTPGAQISFVTRSGTNDWHGTAFDYLRNGVLDANNWFNNYDGLPKISERQNDFGGVLGGPVIIPHVYNGRDRTFFFFSYEGLRVSTPQPAQTILVPDVAIRQSAPAALHPYLNAFPIPNGPDNGDGSAEFTAAYSTPGTVDATSIRIDHTINRRIRLFGRYSYSPSHVTVRGLIGTTLSELTDTSNKVQSFTFGATAVFTPRITNEFRFNYTWNMGQYYYHPDNFGGAVPYSLNSIQAANGQSTTGIDGIWLWAQLPDASWWTLIATQFARQSQINVVDGLNYTSGAHSLKFGFDYRRLETPFQNYKLGEFGIFSSLTQVEQNLPAQSEVVKWPAVPIAPIFDNLSLFAQDEWKATRRLTLSLGLRWEVNPAPGDGNGNRLYGVNEISNLSATAVTPKGTPLWKTTWRNFAPRVGAAYQLFGTPGLETVIRGGFGVFYDTGNTYASQGLAGVGYFGDTILTNVNFPLTTAQLTIPVPSVAPPYATDVYGFDPHLKLPYTLEWSLATEQALGKSQTLTVSYVGAAGRRLLWERQILPANLDNPNFTPTDNLFLTTNAATSHYNSLQLQLRRRLSRGLQMLASYTWSHSIDDSSTNVLTEQLLRASSDFDVRHNFQLAATWSIPGKYSNRFANGLLRNWSLDGRITGHSALPLDVTGGTIVDSSGRQEQLRADLVPGQPLYISDPAAPGGWHVNYNAFTIPTAAEQAAGDYGDAPRNLLRGFPVWQVDTALLRQFPFGERARLQFRAEAFNVFNHPIFGTIQNNLTMGPELFGLATGTLSNSLGGLSALYQAGGSRSLQLSLKLQF
jgi:hypothetical protein